MEFDPEVRGRMWAAMSGTHDLPRPKMWRRISPERYRGGVCRSDDGGKTWQPMTNGLPQTAATDVLLDRRSPKSARVLYVAGFGRGVFRSDDGGATWAAKNQGLPEREPFAWRITQDRDGVLYLVIARRSEDGSIGNALDGALYRSRDRAETWEKVTLPDGVNGPNGLTIDPADPRRLYLAAWARRGARNGRHLPLHRSRRHLEARPRGRPACLRRHRRPAQARCTLRVRLRIGGVALGRSRPDVEANPRLRFQVGPSRGPRSR